MAGAGGVTVMVTWTLLYQGTATQQQGSAITVVITPRAITAMCVHLVSMETP